MQNSGPRGLVFGSVCSGIEAASAGWEQLGWTPAFYSEIDPFPSWVLAQRLGSSRPTFMPSPDEAGLSKEDRDARRAAIKAVADLPTVATRTPNLGDMTKFKEWPDAILDVLVGGTPCQSFSVAGLREGLDDARGNLMLTFASIARRYRPGWLVWENVPGVLSSEGGRDFASLLGILSGRDVVVPPDGWRNSGIVPGIESGYGLAWRVLDAQYFGVPQRRRRVFVVGCLGNWRGAAAVLLERASLRGDPAPRRAKGQRVAPTIEARAGAGGAGWGTDFLAGGGLAGGDELGRKIGDVPETSPTVTSKWAKHSGGPSWSETGNLIVSDVAPTLYGAGNRTGGDRPPGTQVETAESLIAFDETQITSPDNGANPKAGDPSPTLSKGARPPTIAFDCKRNAADSAVNDVSPTLRAMEGKHANAGGQVAIAIPINADALRGAGEARTPSADAAGRVRLRDPGFGIGEDGDPAGTLAAAGPGAVAVNFENGLAPNGKLETSEVTSPLTAHTNHEAILLPWIKPVGYTRCENCGAAREQLADFSPSDRQSVDGFMLVMSACPACGSKDGTGEVTYYLEYGGTVQREAIAFQTAGYGATLGREVSPTIQATGQEGNQVQGVILEDPIAFKASHFTRDKDGAPSSVAPPLSADADKGDQDTLVMTGDTNSKSSTTSPTILADQLTRATDTSPVVFQTKGSNLHIGDISGTLAGNADRASGSAPMVCAVDMQGGKGQGRASEDRSPTLGADTQMHAIGGGGMQVRRLTPLECERLQYFPDDYTLIEYRGKPAADGPRYKALGNSMAVCVMTWIGRRIQAVDDILKKEAAA